MTDGQSAINVVTVKMDGAKQLERFRLIAKIHTR